MKAHSGRIYVQEKEKKKQESACRLDQEKSGEWQLEQGILGHGVHNTSRDANTSQVIKQQKPAVTV